VHAATEILSLSTVDQIAQAAEVAEQVERSEVAKTDGMVDRDGEAALGAH
jgi:hypothetical protein